MYIEEPKSEIEIYNLKEFLDNESDDFIASFKEIEVEAYSDEPLLKLEFTPVSDFVSQFFQAAGSSTNMANIAGTFANFLSSIYIDSDGNKVHFYKTYVSNFHVLVDYSDILKQIKTNSTSDLFEVFLDSLSPNDRLKVEVELL